MEPTTILPIISLLSLVSVEYGAWALLGFLTGRGQLGEFRERFPALGTPTPGCCWCSRSSTSSTRPQRILERDSVAGGLALAHGHHRPIRRLLPPPCSRAEEQQLYRNRSDAGALLIAVALIILAVGLL